MAKSFAQNLHYLRAIYFLQTFALFLRMKRNEFCAIFFAKFAQNRKCFLRKLRMKRNFSFAQFSCAICAKCNFLVTKIDILSLELNN